RHRRSDLTIGSLRIQPLKSLDGSDPHDSVGIFHGRLRDELHAALGEELTQSLGGVGALQRGLARILETVDDLAVDFTGPKHTEQPSPEPPGADLAGAWVLVHQELGDMWNA